MLERTHRRLTFLSLILIMAGSAILCLQNLSARSFWIDELFHVNGAKSILQQGTPVLEGGRIYMRAFPYTYLVALSFHVFGVSELSARLPSIFFSTLTISGVFYVTKKWFNIKTALVAAFLTAFSPLCVIMARECRMYTAFQFTYLVMAYFTYKVIKGNFKNQIPLKFLMALLVFVFFILSYVFQSLAVLFIPTIFAYLLLMTFFSREKSGGSLFTTKYAFLFSIFGFLTLLVITLTPERMEKLWTNAVYLPPWDVQDNPHFYYKWLLEDIYPLFLYAYPISVVLICLKDFRKGLYISLLFVIPFLLLSFAFPRKADRFLLAYLTFFLISISYLITTSVSKVWNWGMNRNKVFGVGGTARKFFACAIVALGLYFSIHPWFGEAFECAGKENRVNWEVISKATSEHIFPDDVIVTTSAMETRHYGFKNHMYALNGQHMIDVYAKESPRAEFGFLDTNSGASMIVTLEDLKAVAAKNSSRNVWFLMNDYEFWNSVAVPLPMRNFIIENCDWYEIDRPNFRINPAEKPQARAFAIGRLRKGDA